MHSRQQKQERTGDYLRLCFMVGGLRLFRLVLNITH